MAKSPTGIIPEELLFPGKRQDVMSYLINLPVEGDYKVDLLVGWAKAVGVTVNSSQRSTVRDSGIDRK